MIENESEGVKIEDRPKGEEGLEPLQLGHLSGATLTYEDAEGEEVVVEFD